MAAVPTTGAPRASGAERVEADAPHPAGAGSSPSWRGRTTDRAGTGSGYAVLALWVLLAVPLMVALAKLRTQHWVPIGDIAQTELRVRDVWSRDPPLIGLAGRIGPFGHQGSHPGPLSFYSLWPVYRLLGATPMALVASGTVLQLLAAGGALWLGFRRGGLRLAIGVALILALLMREYGAVTLTEPWNPYLPVMWWFLFLMALWSVLCDDMVAFPVAVFAGSFCMETHISYLGSVGGLSLVLFAGIVLAWYQRRDRARDRRAWLGWLVGGGLLGVVLWLPPVYEQLTRHPGNGTVIWRHFTNPPETAAGPGKGLQLLLVPLNPWWWVNAHKAVLGTTVPGILVLVVWVAAAVAAWRLRHRALIRLHAVVAFSLVLGLVSASKIFGPVFNYLLLWSWGVAALLFLAVGWTLAAVVKQRWHLPRRDQERLGPIAGLVAIFIVVGLFTASASSVQFRALEVSEGLRRVVNPTAKALRSGRVPGGGRHGRYLVTWTDPIAIGTQGFGLISELERRGFNIGASEINEAGVTPHRLLRAGEYTAILHLSVGKDIDVWAAKPGVRRVAYADLRTKAERVEYARLRSAVIAELRASHHEKEVPAVDGNLFGEATSANLSARSAQRVERMLDLGLPIAVFAAPPSTKQ